VRRVFIPPPRGFYKATGFKRLLEAMKFNTNQPLPQTNSNHHYTPPKRQRVTLLGKSSLQAKATWGRSTQNGVPGRIWCFASKTTHHLPIHNSTFIIHN